MKYILFFLGFSFFTLTSFGQASRLSEDASISIITIGPGVSLIDSFGHTMIRVTDPKRRIDMVYDYGRFDFETPNFLLKFAQGKLLYHMGNSRFKGALKNYKRQNRQLTEQILNLTLAQKQQVFDFLLNNAKPENRNYLYDFFYDNCATRPVDVIKYGLQNEVNFDYTQQGEERTHRDLIHEFVPINSWGSLGIDMALGSVIDRPAKPEEYSFLPEYAMYAFAKAKSSGTPLVKETHDLYKPETPNEKNNNFFMSPLFILGLLSLVLIYKTWKDYKSYKGVGKLDSFVLFVCGIVGILVFLLWFATDHTATQWNYNLLWAFPLHLIAAFVVAKKNPPQWIYPYMKLAVIMLALLGFHHLIGVQKYALTLLPLLVAIAFRYVYILKQLKTIRDEGVVEGA